MRWCYKVSLNGITLFILSFTLRVKGLVERTYTLLPALRSTPSNKSFSNRSFSLRFSFLSVSLTRLTMLDDFSFRKAFIAWSCPTAYKTDIDAKGSCERLAMDGLRDAERITGLVFDQIAIAYVYFVTITNSILIYLFSGTLHSSKSERRQHLLVRYMQRDYQRIYSAHIIPTSKVRFFFQKCCLFNPFRLDLSFFNKTIEI